MYFHTEVQKIERFKNLNQHRFRCHDDCYSSAGMPKMSSMSNKGPHLTSQLTILIMVFVKKPFSST